MIQASFSKYTGCGNDFILIDNRSLFFPSDNRPSVVQKLCHRHLGIGADGVILLENSSKANYRMRIYNSDGTEAEMCGNGIRCLMQFINALTSTTHAHIETMERLIYAEKDGCDIRVEMGLPTDMRWNVNADGFQGHFLNTGVPHFVIFVDDVEGIDLEKAGRALRWHSAFTPKGTNVNFATLLPSCIRYRTFERGVEGETLACGTGAVAVAVAAHTVQKTLGPVTLLTSSGQKLEVNFKEDFSNLTMKGPATHIFNGSVCFSGV